MSAFIAAWRADLLDGASFLVGGDISEQSAS
jgi:hypothetical protein